MYRLKKKTGCLILIAGGVILTLTHGCGTLGVYLDKKPKDPRYYGVRSDASDLAHDVQRCFDDCHPGYVHVLDGMLCLIDLPFSLIADTLLFPKFQYEISKKKCGQAFWNRKYEEWTGAIANGTFDPDDVEKSLGSMDASSIRFYLHNDSGKNPPPELLRALFKLAPEHDYASLVEEIARQKQLTEPLVKSLYDYAVRDKNYTSYIQAALAGNPATPDSYAWRIMQDADTLNVFRALAETQRFSPETLANMWPDPDTAPPTVRYLIANHPATSVEQLEKFFATQDFAIHIALASNTNAPPALLQSLAASPHETARAALIQNPAFPAESFALFSSDTNWVVQSALAKSPRTPPDTLRHTALTCPAYRLNNIIENPNVPDDLLDSIVKDKSIRYTIRDAARAKLKKRQTPRQ